MALNIKNEHAEQVARELARETGESLTEAITRALEDRLQRVRARRSTLAADVDVHRILGEYRNLPLVDDRDASRIVDELYDDDGLPS